MTPVVATQFDRDGFVCLPALLSGSECDAVLSNIRPTTGGAAGSRCLLLQTWCAALAQRLQMHPALAAIIAPSDVAVQCTSFEKSADLNWLTPIHQDLSVPVAHRVDHAALSGWSLKEGTWFVQAPDELLSQLIAVRRHLDDCGPQDGPLRVIPGSHQHGRLDAAAQDTQRATTPEVSCVGARGSVLALRPLLLHASSKCTGTSRRRVLHFLYGPADLPLGLAWQVAL
jgi:ectoine hydroxylase-related dioxygenase (phytanoyl-CoA dioxygenase family)